MMTSELQEGSEQSYEDSAVQAQDSSDAGVVDSRKILVRDLSAILQDAGVRQKMSDLAEARKRVAKDAGILETALRTEQEVTVPVSRLYDYARSAGVEPQYVDAAISAHLITKEQQMRDVALLDATPDYSVQINRWRVKAGRLLDGYRTMLVQALNKEYSSMAIKVEQEERGHWLHLNLFEVSKVSFWKKLGAFVREAPYSLLSFQGLPRWNEVANKKLFELGIEYGCDWAKVYSHSHDPRVLRACSEEIKQFQQKHSGSNIIIYTPRYHYDPALPE